MPRISRSLVAVTAIGLALAVACTPASDQPSAEDALCDSLAAFADSVQAIADLSPETDSVGDAQSAADAAPAAWDQVATAAAEVGEADETALNEAWSDLANTITNLPTDVPLSEAWDSVLASVDDVQGVYTEMRDGLGCA